MAESAARRSAIQSKAVVQHIRGCTQAGKGSLGMRAERWPVAEQEAVEGTTAGRGRTQPGCKASVEEGRRDRWLPDTLAVG